MLLEACDGLLAAFESTLELAFEYAAPRWLEMVA